VLAYSGNKIPQTHNHEMASRTNLISENKKKKLDRYGGLRATCSCRKKSKKFLFSTYQALIWSQNKNHDHNEETKPLKNEFLRLHYALRQ
jgi:hypothetical protein